jgi:ATP-dependent exoDNAse (exonuclease V) beta subunit
VFAVLRGSLFAIGDEELLEYRHRFGHFHRFRIPRELATVDPVRVAPIVSALELLQRLHRSRNHVPVASTISKLLDATRAHVRFALEHGGEQVLANVLHVAELARQYEADGGISFRGFIDELREQAEGGQAGEAPILEEGSDGVRLMTVHKAKGLEFPVVVLADITAKLRPSAASRYLDLASDTCAVRLAGCSPFDLIQHEQEELQRDEAEGVRLAYVAATRARDLLVVPAVGDQEREGWIEPLNRAIYPAVAARRLQVAAPGCPHFTSKDSVLLRPDGDPALPTTVAPGLHNFRSPDPAPQSRSRAPQSPNRAPQSPNHLSPNHQCVWWEPRSLDLGAEPPLGIRRAELIVKDVPKAIVDAGLADYRSWQQSRDSAALSAAVPSIAAQPATAWAKTQAAEEARQPTTVELIEVPRDEGRSTGIRFGTLVHTTLANVPLDASAAAIQLLVSSHARALGATDEEAASAVKVVVAVLEHPLLERARQAAKRNSCRREVPVTFRTPTGSLIEGTIDLVFKERDRWTVVDFKTDEELRRAANYSQQVGLYCDAVRASTGGAAEPVLMRV